MCGIREKIHVNLGPNGKIKKGIWRIWRKSTQEVQFCGAITVQSKLMRYWHEVPPENRDELKQKLFEAIIAFASGPKLVLNCLCIALSEFIVHMLKDWSTAIEDVYAFQNQQVPNVTLETKFWIMLEILSGIPEESNAKYTSVQRVTLRAEISKRTPHVMQTIENYLVIQVNRKWSKEEMGNLTKTAKCTETWVKLVFEKIFAFFRSYKGSFGKWRIPNRLLPKISGLIVEKKKAQRTGKVHRRMIVACLQMKTNYGKLH